jgi:hypothetical protein
MRTQIFDEPSNVTVEDSVVIVKGPDDIDIGLSADAAAVTSDRLFRAALKAKRSETQDDSDEGDQ